MEHTCQHCGDEVIRIGTRGRWPKLCPKCREDPEVAARLRQRRIDEKRQASDRRVDALMARLKARHREDA